MNIDKLLDYYFEAKTSADEERQLRAFFSSGDVPERLEAYKPLFAYFDEEIKNGNPKQKRLPLRRILYAVSAIAASLLLLFVVRELIMPVDPCFCSDNYVVINGQCYTDIHRVRSAAFETLREVATPANEYFPDQEEADHAIVRDQLEELSSLFDN